MLDKFKGKALAVVLVTVMLSISVSPMIFNNQMGTQSQTSGNEYTSTFYDALQQYAEKHGKTVEQLTANWTADDWLRWYKYEGNPSWGSTNITDQFLATDWVKLPNSGNLTWGADYDYEYKYNSTSDRLEMWHNGTLVSYLGSDNLWHYVSDRPNLTDLHQIVDKQYVDHAVTSLGARYYMVNTSSGISDYKLTQLSPPSGSEQSVTKTGLVDDDYIAGWISPDTSMSKLIKGVYNWHIYAEKTGGTQTLRLYWQLVERKSDDTETVIATSAVSNEISTSEGSYIIPLTLSEDYALADGSYIVGKLYADVSDGGSAPDVAIYYDGSSKSHWEIPTNLEIFSDQFLKLDGSNANSDVDISPYNLTVNNISAFNLKSPASYIIWTDGSTIYALNGSTGEIDYSGTDAATVIQNATDTSSDGDMIFIKSGTYTMSFSDGSPILSCSKSIHIVGENRDNTILIAEGGTSNRWTDFFRGTADGITIEHITFDGNADNQPDYLDEDHQRGVWLQGDKCVINDCKIRKVLTIAVNLQGDYNTIRNSLVEYGRVCINGCRNNVLFNQISNSYRAGAIEIYVYPSQHHDYNTVIGNKIFDAQHHGIELYGDTGVTDSPIGNIVAFNQIKNCTNNAIYMSGDGCQKNVISHNILDVGASGSTDLISVTNAYGVPTENTFDNNILYGGKILLKGDENTFLSNKIYDAPHGIYCVNVNYNKFLYNEFYDCATAGIRLYLSSTSDTCSENIVEGNMGYDSDGTHFTEGFIPLIGSSWASVSAQNNKFINNKAFGITTFGDLLKDSGAYIRDNIGYTTENSGSSEITGDGTNTSFSISHGLAATPSQVLVTPTNSSMASATWWVSAKTTTYFNITFSTAPSNGDKLSFDWYAEV